jgi:hypothetical protein
VGLWKLQDCEGRQQREAQECVAGLGSSSPDRPRKVTSERQTMEHHRHVEMGSECC